MPAYPISLNQVLHSLLDGGESRLCLALGISLRFVAAELLEMSGVLIELVRRRQHCVLAEIAVRGLGKRHIFDGREPAITAEANETAHPARRVIVVDHGAHQTATTDRALSALRGQNAEKIIDAHAVPAAQAVRETYQGFSLCAFNGTSALFTAILTAIWFAFVS